MPCARPSATIPIGPHRMASPVALAPMVGITDAALRAEVRAYARAEAPIGLVVSEMISSRALLAASPVFEAKARLEAADGLASVQIAGCDASEMAETARRAEAMGAPIVDINMGCPAKKVTGGEAGSALMRDPDTALRLIEAVARAVDVPVTLKMRLGWCAERATAPEIARRAAEAGVRLIVVHGRTRAQMFTGAADWRAVRATVEAAGAPVLVNGDIDGPVAARRALAESGAAGVMVGRAATARPWLPAAIAAALAGLPYAAPSPAQAARAAARHHAALVARHGAELGLRIARKHLAWRLAALSEDTGLPLAAERAEAVRLGEATAARALLERLADRLEGHPTAALEAAA